MSTHDKINYVELPATDLAATRRFFEEVFGWTFADFGPDYTAFTNAGLRGGFFRSDLRARTANGSALVVLYSDDLEDTQRKVEAAGGVTQTMSWNGRNLSGAKVPNGRYLVNLTACTEQGQTVQAIALFDKTR